MTINWLSKYSEQLKTGKMLHGDGVSFMSLHGIQNLCLLSRIIHKKILVSTRYTPKKSRGLHDIKADILKLVYHYPRMFVMAFRTRG